MGRIPSCKKIEQRVSTWNPELFSNRIGVAICEVKTNIRTFFNLYKRKLAIFRDLFIYIEGFPALFPQNLHFKSIFEYVSII